MEPNKASGKDRFHVEMFKANISKVAYSLSTCWKVVGKTRVTPLEWKIGAIVPICKGKEIMGDPLNYKPLCIFSHARKIVEKAIVMELESLFTTDRAQFGFQEGKLCLVVQIEQAALRVAELIRNGVRYVLVLDLSKAYDTVLKLLLIKKLQRIIPSNLLSQVKVFISTVVVKVSGEILNTLIPMRRGLTQAGTTFPPLFRIFINDLPEELRKIIREKFPSSILDDHALLVADDVIDLSATLKEMKEIANNTCCKWVVANGLTWNPLKSHLLKIL